MSTNEHERAEHGLFAASQQVTPLIPEQYIKRYRDSGNIDSVVLVTEPQTPMLCAQLR